MNKFDGCFSEIEISIENQVSNITEKKENKRKNCPHGEENGFPKRGYPKESREGRKPLISGKRVQKKAWQAALSVVKYLHISRYAHQPMMLLSIAQGEMNFNRKFWNRQFLQAKRLRKCEKWCGFCSDYIKTAHNRVKFAVVRNRIFWINRLLSWLLIKGRAGKGLALFEKF